eukprot:g17179.t1
MFLTLCHELREIFAEDDTESCFGDDSDWEAGCEYHFEHRRLRSRQSSLEEYDPDDDDYQMTVQPELLHRIEAKEKCLLKKQISHLHHRIQGGGPSEILDHYYKVKEDLVLQLAGLHGNCLRRKATCDEVMSMMSTLDTCLNQTVLL